MRGFPPDPTGLVTLANWQEAGYLRWAFQHMRELMPSQPIRAATTAPWPLRHARRRLGNPPVLRLDGRADTFEDVIADTWTDAVLVLHEGRIVLERYYGDMTPQTPHLLMSVSKSIVGCVAGLLIERGALDPAAQVTNYVPEVAGSGYAGATVRDLLDMRTGVAFRETYTAPDAEVRVMERSMGWRPALADDPLGAYAYLAALGTAGPHGGDFVYRSADTDMLGWVCERAGGMRMADQISSSIWQPMGAERDAEITCDAVGSAVHDGGISATLRDVARFGRLLLDDGAAHGRQVVPERWLVDARSPDDDVRSAFARSENEPVLPGGWYRNQFWFVPGHNGPVQVCLGIHGQMVFIDHATRTVAVKLSSWPAPQDVGFLVDTLRAFGVLGAHLAGLDG